MNHHRTRALLVGSTGFLGSILSQSPVLRSSLDLRTASRNSGDLRIDLADTHTFSPVREYLRDERPHYLILTAAVTDVEACAQDPVSTQAINVRGTTALLDIAREFQVTPIFFSSDYALEPITRLALLSEDAPLHPQTEYGRQKAAIETYLRDHFDRHLIFRTSKIMSLSPHPKSILHAIIRPLVDGKNIRPFHDQWMTPVFAEDVAQVLSHPKLSELSGTYHLATRQVFTRSELTQIIRDQYFPNSPSEISPISLTEIQTREKRPHYNTLDSSKISHALGFQFREITDELPRIIQALETEPH